MKKRAIKFCSLIGLLFGLMISAQAQAQYRVEIPFDFNVGGSTFQSGVYMIGLTGIEGNKDILTIREMKTGKAKMFRTNPKTDVKSMEASKIVFNRYEDRYFLAEMITPTINTEFYMTKTEKRFAKLQKPRLEEVAIK